MDPLLKFEDKFLILNNLYKKLPLTQCAEKCGTWCCTKLKELCDDQGNFLSLPLVYSIEFQNIRSYLINNFTKEEISKLLDIKNKALKCAFHDAEKKICLINEVKPFSCRVYGHRVPPFFWGIKYPEHYAENIYCKNMKILDYQEEASFMREYKKCWDTLALLSKNFSLFTSDQRAIIKKTLGVDDIKILGWLEYNFLINNSLDWYKTNFSTFWKIHGSLL